MRSWGRRSNGSVLAAAFVLGGCAIATPATSATAEPTLTAPTATAMPYPSDPPSPTTANDPTAEPTSTLTELEASDIFWDSVSYREWAGSYLPSLAALTREADLIVVGRVTGLRFGDVVEGWEVTRLTVAADEILKGDPQTQNLGTIRIQTIPTSDRQGTQATMPAHLNLLFLYYAPWLLERLDQPAEEQAESLYDYLIINGGEGLIRNLDGVARSFERGNEGIFPATLNGRPFEDVLAKVREIVERQGDQEGLR